MNNPAPERGDLREVAFSINDVARLLRISADHKAGELGMSRAQWAVMARLQRAEGLKQSELAEILDIQPITLTRLVDRLCDSGLIERRQDPDDRRAKRLFLTPAATPVMDRLHAMGEELMAEALRGLSEEDIATLKAKLGVIKDNLRQMLQWRCSTADKQKTHG